MKASLLISALLLASPALAEDVDLDVVHRIKQEAFLNSKVMDYMHLIADENGPRMSGSPAYRRGDEPGGPDGADRLGHENASSL